MIRKAVIPVAGIGTRFLPTTKAQPKEMMSVVDKPVIQLVIEDLVKSGITDIILITGPAKRAVEDHFSPNYELVNILKKQGKIEMAEEVKRIADMANFIFIRQRGPYGNGTPVLCAKPVVGDEPFIVKWGDDFIYSPKKPYAKQLIDTYDKYGDPVLTAYQVDDEGTSQYGIIEGLEVENSIYQVQKLKEKPGPKNTTSRLASLGGYILTPDIFDILEKTKIGKGGELWLMDAIITLQKNRPIYAKKVQGTYYDTGSKIGYLKANVDFALRDPKIKKEFKKYLKSVV